MKSYKQRTLEGQLDLIRRYRENDPPQYCPFCVIYLNVGSCRGCFMADIIGKTGCSRFFSSMFANRMASASEEERLARAEFHEKVREILLERPDKYFTPSKWKYLDIPESW